MTGDRTYDDGKNDRDRPSPLVVFEPATQDDLRKGWQVHVARRRTIHEQAARRTQSAHYAIGSTAVVLAGFAGSSLVSSWTTDAANGSLRFIGGVAGALAAMLTAFQTFLDLGGRAERHRQAANEYKALLRKFESMAPGRNATASCTPVSDREYRAWPEQVQAELLAIDNKAPVVPRGLAKRTEGRKLEWASTADGLLP